MPLSAITRNSGLIRKAQDAVIMLGPSTAPEITSITSGASPTLNAIDPAYVSLGRHTKDHGLVWNRDIKNDEVFSHGVSDAVRRDITSDVMSVKVTLQESKLMTLQLALNADLSTVVPTPVTGEVYFRRPTTPSTTYFRLLALAQDGAGTSTYYYARFLPRVLVSDVNAQSWSETTEIQVDVTFTATVDDALGYAVSELWGGPGLQAALPAMGFPPIVVPVAPTGLTLGAKTTTTVVLSWNATAGATSYTVSKRTPAGSGSFTAVLSGAGGTPTTNSTTITGLTTATSYDFEVFAVNTIGPSATPSNVVTVTTS